VPKLSRTPGATRWPGGELGHDNREVLEDLLGLDEQQMSMLRSAAVII
jgi:crotonobetainyl-CoA:carnitine CoA-transferase CaiB-like acyl-CoA transferase